MALREINLIPGELTDRRLVARHVRLWVGVGVLLLACVGGIYGMYVGRVLPRLRPAVAERDVHRRLGTTVAEIEDIHRALNQLAATRTVLNSPSFYTALSNLTDSMEPRTWLAELKIDPAGEGEKGSRMVLSGYAASNAELGLFLSRLAAQPMFSDVELQFSKESRLSVVAGEETAERKVTQFRIHCRIVEG